MNVKVLVEELGSFLALAAIPAGPSPFAFAFEISDSTARSFKDIPRPESTSALALISLDMVFLLRVSVSSLEDRNRRSMFWPYTHASSASVMVNVLGSEICRP